MPFSILIRGCHFADGYMLLLLNKMKLIQSCHHCFYKSKWHSKKDPTAILSKKQKVVISEQNDVIKNPDLILSVVQWWTPLSEVKTSLPEVAERKQSNLLPVPICMFVLWPKEQPLPTDLTNLVGPTQTLRNWCDEMEISFSIVQTDGKQLFNRLNELVWTFSEKRKSNVSSSKATDGELYYAM